MKLYNETPRGYDDPQELFECFQNLVESGYPFYRVDRETRFGTKVAMFSHFSSDYSAWERHPLARECRGVLFELDDNDKNRAIRIMSRPLEKFFNWGECIQSSFPIEAKNIEAIESKEDGSIISTYWDISKADFYGKPELFVKSKMSLESTMAVGAMQLLNGLKYPGLKQVLLKISLEGLTVSMEYVSPTNRIVLEYKDSSLIVYDIRCNNTGLRVNPKDLEFLTYKDLEILEGVYVREFENTLFVDYPESMSHDDKMADSYNRVKEYQNTVKHLEGLIIYDKYNGPFKIKTSWYTEIHRVKYTISSNRNLFKSIVSGDIDDIRVLYLGETLALQRIDSFNEAYLKVIANQVKLIQDLLEELKGSDRKAYALKAQEVVFRRKLPKYIFSIIMNCYNRVIDWDDIIKELNDKFILNYKLYVPTEYTAEYDSEGLQMEYKEEE